MFRLARHSLFVPALALLLCGPGCGGQVGEESGIFCGATDTTPLALDEESPLGFSAADVLASASGERNETLNYRDATASTIAVEVSVGTGDIEFQLRDWISDGNDTLEEPAIGQDDCPDAIEIPLAVRIVTADGSIDGTFAATTHAVDADGVALNIALDNQSGTLDPADFAPAGDWQEFEASLQLRVTADAIEGTLNGQASRVDGEVAEATNYTIATFGGQLEE